MKALLFNALLACCFALTVQSANAQKPNDEQSIRTWMDNAMAIYFSADVAKMVDLYTDDAVVIDFMGVKTSGKAAIKASIEQQMAYQKPDPTKMSSKVEEIHFLNPDCAHVIAHMKGSSQMGDQIINWESYDCFTIIRKKGNWQVAFEQMTGINPPTQGQ
jgi:uncharacterized protein (TIGR02246 family)